MPAITVGLPASLTTPKPPHDLGCEAETAMEALKSVISQAPYLESRLFYKDRLLVMVLRNGKQLLPDEIRQAELASGDRLDLVLAIAGG